MNRHAESAIELAERLLKENDRLRRELAHEQAAHVVTQRERDEAAEQTTESYTVVDATGRLLASGNDYNALWPVARNMHWAMRVHTRVLDSTGAVKWDSRQRGGVGQGRAY